MAGHASFEKGRIASRFAGFFLLSVLAGCDHSNEANSKSEESGAALSCEELDYDGVSATCRAAAEEAGCQGASDEVGALGEAAAGGPCFQCVWTDWVATTLAADGACSYAPVVPTCEPEALYGDLGCDGISGPCTGGQGMRVREGDAGREILIAPMCLSPAGSQPCYPSEGSDEPVVPECACGCDPAFPGA